MKVKKIKIALLCGMLGCVLMGTGDWLMLYGDPTATGAAFWLTEGAAQIPAWRNALSMAAAFPAVVFYGIGLFGIGDLLLGEKQRKIWFIIPNWRYLKPVLPLGAGSFLTQLCIVATTIANNILLKSYGAQSAYGPDIPLSAFVVIIKLFQIILNIACGITAGALPIMGYNYGARLYSRVKETFKLVVLSTFS